MTSDHPYSFSVNLEMDGKAMKVAETIFKDTRSGQTSWMQRNGRTVLSLCPEEERGKVQIGNFSYTVGFEAVTKLLLREYGRKGRKRSKLTGGDRSRAKQIAEAIRVRSGDGKSALQEAFTFVGEKADAMRTRIYANHPNKGAISEAYLTGFWDSCKLDIFLDGIPLDKAHAWLLASKIPDLDNDRLPILTVLVNRVGRKGAAEHFLPLVGSDHLRIVVSDLQSNYFYLLWIDCDGNHEVLFPGADNLRSLEQVVKDEEISEPLTFPSGNKWVPLKSNKRGYETVICMESSKKLGVDDFAVLRIPEDYVRVHRLPSELSIVEMISPHLDGRAPTDPQRLGEAVDIDLPEIIPWQSRVFDGLMSLNPDSLIIRSFPSEEIGRSDDM